MEMSLVVCVEVWALQDTGTVTKTKSSSSWDNYEKGTETPLWVDSPSLFLVWPLGCRSVPDLVEADCCLCVGGCGVGFVCCGLGYNCWE